MATSPNPDLEAQFGAALDWWREAGVDLAFTDIPRNWLGAVPGPSGPGTSTGAEGEGQGRGAGAMPVAAPAPVPEPAVVRLPDDLPAFRDWWMREPSLDSEHLTGRIAPRGEPGAALMVLVPSPEEEDRAHLLSGAQGRLLAGLLRAAGLDEDRVYFASVLPCHTPGADWSPTATQPLARALVRHVALVRPERLLVLGGNILPLLGHDLPHGGKFTSVFNHEGVTIPLLAVRKIPAAASQPRWKAALWQAWLDWTA